MDETNDRLLAHPLPNLRYAVYAPKDAVAPIAIFQDFTSAVGWSVEVYGHDAEVRTIALFSDRMPVAEPNPKPKWRSDT